MADNTQLPGTGTGTADIKVATRKVTYSGDASVDMEVVGLAVFSGSDDAKTVADLPGDVTNGLDVDVTRMPSAATGTTTAPAASASNGTVLASNSARKGATLYNDSTSLCYVKLGATASSTSFTVKMAAGGYFEVPFSYTGIIDAIWATAAGAMRVTELT